MSCQPTQLLKFQSRYQRCPLNGEMTDEAKVADYAHSGRHQSDLTWTGFLLRRILSSSRKNIQMLRGRQISDENEFL